MTERNEGVPVATASPGAFGAERPMAKPPASDWPDAAANKPPVALSTPQSERPAPSKTGLRKKWQATGRPARFGIIAMAGVLLFLAVLADTVFGGLLTKVLEPVNDQVSAWRDAGYPVLAWGRELSKLGDFLVLFPILACAFGMALGVGAWRRALTILLAGFLMPYLISGLQSTFTGMNHPIPGLDPLMVPDTQSGPRIGGEHLFPSGHVAEAVLGWGLFLVLAVPLALRRHVRKPGLRRFLLGTAVAVWVLAWTLTGVGRILRQAHGLNDVLAGLGVGLAVLFATLAVVSWLWPDEPGAAAPTEPVATDSKP